MRRFETLLPVFHNDGREVELVEALETRSPGLYYSSKGLKRTARPVLTDSSIASK